MHSEILKALIVPGWTARNRRRRLAWSLLVAGIVVPIALLVHVVVADRNGVAMGLDAGFLLAVVVVGALAVSARALAVGEIWFDRVGYGPRLGFAAATSTIQMSF